MHNVIRGHVDKPINSEEAKMEYVILTATLFALMSGVLAMKINRERPVLIRVKTKKD